MNARKKILEIRQKKGIQSTILKNEHGLINVENITKTRERWDKKKGTTTKSYDKILRKKQGTIHQITATNIATRLATKDLLKGIKIPITIKQKKTLEYLIAHRPQKIPQTNIELRPQPSVFVIELVNALGQKKTTKIFDSLYHRSRAIQRLAVIESRTKKEKTDIFHNVGANVGAKMMLAEIFLKDHAELLKDVNSFISQRQKDIKHLEESKIINKQIYLNKLKTQLNKATTEKAKYLVKQK